MARDKIARAKKRAPGHACPAYGVVLVGAHEWWCAWSSGKAAHAGEPPERSGWAALPTTAVGVIQSVLGLFAGAGEPTPGAARALSIAEGFEPGSRVLRDDALAAMAYEAAGAPQPGQKSGDGRGPSVHAAAAPPEWARELRVAFPCSRADIETAFRRRVGETHPDGGGSAAAFRKVKHAHEQAIGWVAAREAADDGG